MVPGLFFEKLLSRKVKNRTENIEKIWKKYETADNGLRSDNV